MTVREPKPMHFLLAWDLAEAVIERLSEDQPWWNNEPFRERMHRAVFQAVVRELEEAA